MRQGIVLVLVAALAGCERPPLALDLSGERIMVHSVLVAERDVVQVLVERVSPLPMPDPVTGASLDLRPVSGARVEVEVDGEVIVLEEAPPEMPPCASAFPFPVPQPEPIGPGCYVARIPGGVAAGSRYQLSVRVAGDVVAIGEVVVPGTPELVSPAPGERFDVIMGATFSEQPLPGIQVSYRLPTAVAGLRTSLAFDSVFADEGRVEGARCEYAQFENAAQFREADVDSLVFVPRGLYCFRTSSGGGTETFRPDSIFGRLSLAGFDSTYMRYDEAARQESAELTSLQAGLEGALGLFAGASVTRTAVVLLPVGEVH